MTFGLGNSPAELSALEASRGRLVRIMELASVRGRSGEEGRSGTSVSGGVVEGEAMAVVCSAEE